MLAPSEIYITSFDNMKSSKSNIIPLFQEFGNIKRGKYKDLIVKCRAAIKQNDKELYVSLKNQLPAVTFCGEFSSGRKASDIIKYNNLMILDVDNLDAESMDLIKTQLQKDKYMMALWLSPSALGLKGIVKIDSDIDKHKYVFNALRIYFLENYKIELDRSGSDVSRLCFSSWDENFFYNGDSEIFRDYLEIEEIKENNFSTKEKKNLALRKNANVTEGFNKSKDTKIIREIIKFLEKKDVSITSSYDEWVKVALGISYTFSYDVGEKYFLKICSLDKEKHSEDQSIMLLRYCYNKRDYNSSNSISIGTIIYFAKLKGFIIRKNNYS
jgi:hypothetical protein